MNPAEPGLPVDPGHAPWTLRLMFLAIGAWTASIAPFAAVILQAHGLSTVEIGVLSAIAALAAALLVPAWGHLADVVVGRTLAFRLALAVAVASAVALLLPLPAIVLAPLLASFTIYPPLFLALGDALAIGALRAPERQYGAVRAIESLSFAVGVIAAGLLYDRAGYAVVPIVAIGWALVLTGLIGPVDDPTRDPAVRERASRHGGDALSGRFGSISRALAIQPRLWPVLGVLTVVFIGLQGSVVFVGIRIVDLGGQPSDVALTFGIASFAEIPGLMFAGWVGARIGLRGLVVGACVIYGLSIVSWGVLPTPVAINATRLLTGVCFGALFAARVLVIARLLPVELQATGQTMLGAATSGLGSALGAIFGGIIYAVSGPTVYFAVAGAMAIAGGIGAWFVLHGPVGGRLRATETLEPAV